LKKCVKEKLNVGIVSQKSYMILEHTDFDRKMVDNRTGNIEKPETCDWLTLTLIARKWITSAQQCRTLQGAAVCRLRSLIGCY